MRIAIFDIGTNSIHMKIVQVYDNLSFEVLEHEKDMTRIGKGSFKSGKLTKESMKRALRVLDHFADIAKKNGVTKKIAVATSAVRDAKNGKDFVRQIYKKTGIKVRVISGEEEARLIFLGASSGMDLVNDRRVLAIDIGGGSAEIVLGNSHKLDYEESFQLGVARLKDRFFKNDPPKKDEIHNLKSYIQGKFLDEVEKVRKHRYSIVIGTGGTLINLASLVYERREGRRLKLRGYFELRKKDLSKLNDKLIHLSSKKINKMPGIDKKRADIITVGGILTEAFLSLFKAERILVADKGIREGMILNFMLKKALKRRKIVPNVRVQWFGQKPFFSGRILLNKKGYF